MNLQLTTPLIIFDWDGTVMDSVGRIVSSMQLTARDLDLPIPTALAVRDIIGISLMPAIDRLFGTLSESQLERFFAVYRHYYIDADQTPSPVFPDAETVLQQLHTQGFQLAVATGKARHGLERVWAETGLDVWFHYSRCADEAESKP
ncbi:HAD family hydrolase, partial [Pseudidiomarina aestuarii]